MNILYLCHRIPCPPHTGDKVRSFQQIRHLAQRHRIALACFADDPADYRQASSLERWCASVDVVYRSRRAAKAIGMAGFAQGQSLSVAAFRSAALSRRIAARAAAGPFDAIVAFSGAMAVYGDAADAAVRVIDFVDVDSEKWRAYAAHHPWPVSWLYRIEADRLRRFEVETARRWDHALFVSDREADLIRKDVPDRAITVLSNGVDLEYFHPGPPPSGPPFADVIFTGAMDYFPNVDAALHFCESVFPLVRAQVPTARFAIVGRNPAPEVRRLAERPGVIVQGTVPDIREYMRGARVSVAPLRIARGIQNKILEAMAMGIPVVSTPDAAQGLDTDRPEGVSIADGPEDFAAAVVRLLRDEEHRRDQAARARAYVERHHRWERHGARLEALLAERAASRGGASGREADRSRAAR